jgi:SM-20-related protein
MSLINLDAVRQAQLHPDPFDFLVVPDFVSRDVLLRVNEDYPPIDTAANHPLKSLQYGPLFGELVEEIQSTDFAETLGARFDLELAPLPTTITVRKFCERTDGNIHTDHKSKVITVLLYFNENWNHQEGQLRILRSPRDIEDYNAQVPPYGGTLLAFRRTDHSWHGHTRFVGERRMLQLNYLNQSPLAVATQRISRFGTHFMKNVLGMR